MGYLVGKYGLTIDDLLAARFSLEVGGPNTCLPDEYDEA